MQGHSSVFRTKYDGSTIPGTDPPSAIEEVYTNILAGDATGNSGGVSGLTLEGGGGSAASQRGGSSF